MYRAVEIHADPENQPIFVHCWEGQHRTDAVIAAYRLMHSGWSEEARKELSRWGGFSEGKAMGREIVMRVLCRIPAG